MSFIACMLLLYVDEVEAFICFANMLNRKLLMTFFKMDADGVCADFFSPFSLSSFSCPPHFCFLFPRLPPRCLFRCSQTSGDSVLRSADRCGRPLTWIPLISLPLHI